MTKSKQNFCIGFLMIIFIFFITSVLLYLKITNYKNEYIFLSVCMIIFLFINMLFFSCFGVYIFEPITIIFILYLFVFFITPIINILTNDTDVMGFNVMGGCIKATIIFMLSYVGLLFGYYGRIFKKVNIIKPSTSAEQKTWKNTKIEKIALIIWIVSFIFGCIELVSKGMSISYFLTLGSLGEIEDIAAESIFGFLGNFRVSMISAWLYLFVANKKSFKTILCGILTLEYFVLRGFRHSLFVLIFAPIIYIYVKDKKKPKTSILILFGVLIVVVMGGMQFIRGALREGTAINWSVFDIDIFIDSIKGNCNIYKTFYGMVDVVPTDLDYQFGMCSIVSVITMAIPRSIWSAKPISPIITYLGMFCGSLAAKSGFAMPNISEYYLDFGTVGCIVCLFIFGVLLKKMKNIIRYKRYDTHLIIAYSILFPALLQVVLRGYSPSYVYLLLFYLLPVFCIRILGGKE